MLPAGAGCEPAQSPSHFRTAELVGAPYHRGFQHGERYSSEIRSLYTKLLLTSIMPYLNRERATISEVLVEYEDDQYDDGQFSYLLFLESALNLEASIPQDYLDEMHGIADGAGIPYEDVLILNTFFDTLVAFRAMSFFLVAIQAPQVMSISFEGAESDGLDNDDDGLVDEPGEATLDPFDPSQVASLVEVPTDAVLRLNLEAPAGVDPERVRIETEETVYTIADPAVETQVYGADDEGLEVTFRHPTGFASGAYHAVIVSAGDTIWVEDPPPAHAHMMRDTRIGFTTAGYGLPPHEVDNRGFDDGRSQPVSIGFALRDSATPDGRLIMGQHFALLDSNTSHKHSAVFLHRPDQGRDHVVVGWTGVIFGFAGMNADGLAYAINLSDTLDNPLAKEFQTLLVFAKLISSGMPIGVVGREILAGNTTVEEAVTFLRTVDFTYGWNILLGDAAGEMSLLEVDSNINEDATSFHVITPDTSDASNVDEHGDPWASVGPDDLRMGIHYRKNCNDLWLNLFGYELKPQRFWTSYYFRSVRSYFLMGDAIEAHYGGIDVPTAKSILSTEGLVDQRDSMNAVVFEPERARLHVAIGEVPATDAPFVQIDLAGWLSGEDVP